MTPITPPLKAGDRGGAVGNLIDGLLLLLDKGLIQAPPLEQDQLVNSLRTEQHAATYADGTLRAVTLFQEKHRLQASGAVNGPTADAMNGFLKALGALGLDLDEVVFTVDGTVLSRERAGVGGLRVVIVDKNVGESGDLVLAEVTTNDDGNYRATFTLARTSLRGKTRPDLQARALHGETLLATSAVRYNATNRETLNLTLTARAAATLPSELETLTSALSARFRGNLRDLKESEERQDVTYLANKTGWDARAVALAALADQFSARTADATGQVQLEAPFFYALFRAGVPANEPALYQTTASVAVDIWKQAIAQGIIPAALEARIPQAGERFEQLSVQHSLDGPALAGLSTLKDMLTISLGEDPTLHKKFAELYARHRGDPTRLWAAVRESLGEPAEQRLRLDGQLGYLTRNNGPLIRKLHEASGHGGMTDTVTLAEQGYYHSDKWRDLVGDDPIPPEVLGDAKEQRARYAELLAAQVRLSFPTMVVAQMVKSGETPLASDTLDRRDRVHAFLAEHQGKFELGLHPVQRYIARHQLQVPGDVSSEVTRIQRVYQITPSDTAMNALLRNGIDSALAVSRFERQQFVRRYSDELGGEANARATHAKAQQVHSVVLNLATSYLVARTTPQIGVHSPAKYGNANPTPIQKAQSEVSLKQVQSVKKGLDKQAAESPDNAADLIPYATLEALLGEMDYCDCDHCHSWLSPAAYLVDLLQFLDRTGQPWTEFLKEWKSGHAEVPYPYSSQPEWQAAGKPADSERNPLQVLLNRRPDLEHLPLTCENTNTPVAYIDLVNETLEYYITNNLSLAEYRGHTTDGSMAPEELLATPQFVRDAAYETLAGKYAPASTPPVLSPTTPLPFHQPLETLRHYFDKFDAPLPGVMEALRVNDDVDRPPPADSNNPMEYGWRDILMEELRLSRAEYARLTDATLTLNQLYGFKPETSQADVVDSLSNVKAFARRMDISYADIIDILKTRFINPNSTLLPKLEQLGVSFATLKTLKDSPLTGQAWLALLPQPMPDAPLPSGDLQWEQWVKNDTNYSRIMALITLADTGVDQDPCNFENLEFRYADPVATNTLRPFEFHRLIRFIRLWKKLGWTIEQTDAAITALYPESQTPNSPTDSVNLQLLGAGFLSLLPRLGVLKRLMTVLKLSRKRDLLALLACFAPIDTNGHASLYRQMFLRPAPPAADSPFADDGFGNFFTKDAQLLAQVEVLRAAFLLTDDELKHITGSLGYGADTKLTLDTIGAVFRRGWLARKLKLSVREFLLLTEMTAIDPFAMPDPPRPGILQFIDLVARLRAVSLKPEQALYLFWNQDISGKSAPDATEILEFVRTVRAGFAAVESEFALADDPGGQIAHARMALVYGTDTADFLFGLLGNTLVSAVHYDHTSASLEQTILNTASGRIGYDDFAKRLSFTGVMSDDTQAALKVGTPLVFETAVDELYSEIQRVIRPFFDRSPELWPLYSIYAFFGELNTWVTYQQSEKNQTLAAAITAAGQGRLAYDHALGRLSYKGVMSAYVHNKLKQLSDTPELEAAIDSLLSANASAIDKFFQGFKQDFSKHYPDLPIDMAAYLAANDSEGERRTLFLSAFLPELKRRRKRQQAMAAVSVAANTDLVFASAILDDKLVLNPASAPVPAAADDLPPALDDLTAIEKAGLSARFYSEATVGGGGAQPDPISDAETNLDYPTDGAGSLPLKPGSGIWSGYLEAPVGGLYNFSFEPGVADGAGAGTVTFSLDGHDRPLDQNGQVWSNTTAIELRAGALYSVTFEAVTIGDGLKVRWQTRGRGWEVVPPQYLYSATLINHLRVTYVRFLKAASLTAGLKLTPSETAFFASSPAYQIANRGWLNSLPGAGNPDEVTASELLKALEAVLDFAGLKARLAPGDERLLEVLKDPNATVETTTGATASDTNKQKLVLALTRWEGASLDALLLRFGKHLTTQPEQAERAALKDPSTFVRVYRAYGPVKKLGVAASSLIAATTNEPRALAVRTFQSALRARYEESDWLSVLRPINDDLRSLQRDALVGYILHQLRANPESEHIDTPDKLFEYFLMDVQMDPCMQTSRIRNALSSVQLFIERCFMNLETGVDPSVFDSSQRKQWGWMKRYRVWEANRKVFLWPENWIQPELRTDQSPLIKEGLSELMQSDITDDRAAAALLNYLSKLEEVAKLEPCGIHFVEGATGTSDGIAHVVARTTGANRKYFYRRYDGLWTPWEQIKLDIEDNPVTPVVWNDRLLLFWLKILKDAPLDPPQGFSKKKPSDISPELAKWDQYAPPDDTSLADLPSSAVIPKDVPQIDVNAVLCWSEYYNGKWQSAKTSNVSLPTTLGQFNSAKFDRTALRLWVNREDGRLGLTISDQGDSEFLLLNTHGLPVSGGEFPDSETHDFVAPHAKDTARPVVVSNAILRATYFGPFSTANVPERKLLKLKSTVANDPVAPRHDMSEAWAAPFFYEDRRHAFYVTTAKAYVPVKNADWSYGIKDAAADTSLSPVTISVSTKWTVSDDAYITRTLPMANTVYLDGGEIGPSGHVTNVLRKQ